VTYTIFGATGKVGRATARALRDQGQPVRAVVRDERRGRELAEWGCGLAVADVRDPATIARAVDGAHAVQVICPIVPTALDAPAELRGVVDAFAEALISAPPPTVLAISDYGAELDSGTGITQTFHQLEQRMRELPSDVTFLRSAEHMQNWRRQVPAAVDSGVLGSLHQPLTKRFPTVSAPDLGAVAPRAAHRRDSSIFLASHRPSRRPAALHRTRCRGNALQARRPERRGAGVAAIRLGCSAPARRGGGELCRPRGRVVRRSQRGTD
jgi:NAD(P)H dehydrogenase (quinone)